MRTADTGGRVAARTRRSAVSRARFSRNKTLSLNTEGLSSRDISIKDKLCQSCAKGEHDCDGELDDHSDICECEDCNP